MGAPDESSHTFVVRVWREAREFEGTAPTWRGRIEHVQSGGRRYIKSPDELVAFIGGYLTWLGAVPAPRRTWRSWLTRRQRS